MRGINVNLCSCLKKKSMAHLTIEQRYTIAVMWQNGYTITEIDWDIGVRKSTVSRELARSV